MAKNYKLNKLTPELLHAYGICQAIANAHYENFPVASKLLPRHLRRSIAAIYAFARTADDISDEGDLTTDTRLELMTKFETSLYDIQYGKPPTEPLFIAIKHTIECFNLPIQLFYDLLTAFRQDILKNRYKNFSEVKDYCHYSANPVGRLLLHLAGQATPDNLLLSDSICTGLQLINFLQDIEIDLLQMNRCYIPLDELDQHGLTLEDLRHRTTSANYQALIAQQIKRTTEIYTHGMPLQHNLPGFFGVEIRFIIAGGYKVLQKLAAREDIWQRPTLSKVEMGILLAQTIFKRKPQEIPKPTQWKNNGLNASSLLSKQSSS